MALFMLTESKRDDLLLPYFNLVKDKIPGLTLGKFKSIMLDKLAAQGCIKNLSLGSNFYLAGATRYYFQGALTTDGQAHLLSGDPMVPDNWNVDICKRLNALVNVLRNAYIDTVGTQFEQPEDFGTLPLNKLLRKYGKKIEIELGMTPDEEESTEEEEDNLDRSNRVGNGYTFDILYQYSDATKYERATAPGSWCITYGQGHFDRYIRLLNIHYVIFLKDGYENVPRQTGPGYTRSKPHDEYGNSMIAYLQSNKSWMPEYITSRWNHGYGETDGTEADRAYTLEEFCDITGVTPEDLQRIYAIWQADEDKYGPPVEITPSREEVKTETLSVTRKLKYAQMVINTGANILDALRNAGVEDNTVNVLYGNGELKKSIACARVNNDYVNIHFLIDRGKILFESFVVNSAVRRPILPIARYLANEETQVCPLIFILKGNNKCLIYNGRFHEFVSINGEIVFKKTIINTNGRRDASRPAYLEVKNGTKDIALISMSDGRPLRLPNGEYWFNDISYGHNYWQSRNQIHCNIIGQNPPIAKIVYDESAGITYFFNTATKKFMDFNIVNHDEITDRYYYQSDPPENFKLAINTDFSNLRDYFSMYFVPPRQTWVHTKPMLFNLNGQQVSIYGRDKFPNLRGSLERIISYTPGNDEHDSYYYDTATKKLIAIGDTPIVGRYAHVDKDNDKKVIFIEAKDESNMGRNPAKYFAYDTERGLIIKNPINYPDEKTFYMESRASGTFYIDEFDYWGYSRTLDNQGLTWQQKHEAIKKEQKKHLSGFDEFKWEYFPNDLPVNNENELAQMPSQQGVGEPALSSVNEDVIRKIVAETLRNIME